MSNRLHDRTTALAPYCAPPRSRLTLATAIAVASVAVVAVALNLQVLWIATVLGALACIGLHQRELRAMAARREWLERLALVAIRTSNSVLITDAAGQITWVNDAFTRLSGYTLEEATGWHPGRLLGAEDADPVAVAKMSEAIRTGSDARVTVPNKSRDGQRYWVDITIEPIRLNGELEGFISVQTNVTEQVQATAALRASQHEAESANRIKGEFVANMSHEIRTPLTAILGHADLLLTAKSAVDRAHSETHALQTICRAGEHLMRILNDILDLSKIDADKLEIETVEMSLPGLLMDVESLMRPRALEKKLHLESVLSSPVPNTIIADPTRLRQILVNLVGNAIKFTDRGGVRIDARLERGDDQQTLVIAVEDTGAGIDQTIVGSLFDPFVQADSSVTRRFGGTGLGLPISRRLAERMGGSVHLDRSQAGEGSRFQLSVPVQVLARSPLVTQLETVPMAADQREPLNCTLEGRILLAEDGEDNQRVIAELLRRAGATVTVVDNGQLALSALTDAMCRDEPFNLVLTDIQMPVMDGYALVHSLRSIGSTVPVVALTAHARPEDRQQCITAGCNDFATKPIRRDALLSICAQWLRAEAPSADRITPLNILDDATPLRVESALRNDPELGALAIKFGSVLPDRVSTIQSALELGDTALAKRLAHQLTGAAGSYGYPQIASLAALLERQVEDATVEARQTLAHIARLASAARRSAREPVVVRACAPDAVEEEVLT